MKLKITNNMSQIERNLVEALTTSINVLNNVRRTFDRYTYLCKDANRLEKENLECERNRYAHELYDTLAMLNEFAYCMGLHVEYNTTDRKYEFEPVKHYHDEPETDYVLNRK